MPLPLMPKATAVWLVDNTSLTFEQIGKFCGLHTLEVKGIADGEVAIGIQGRNPIADGELTDEEIKRCSADATIDLEMAPSSIPRPSARTSGPKYTPVTKRQDRPNAIMWLLRYHSELSDAQICRLVGTTKPTVNSVRERTHWNMPNLKPLDPVSLGMSSQTELDEAVMKATARRRSRERRNTNDESKNRIGPQILNSNLGEGNNSNENSSSLMVATEKSNDLPTANLPAAKSASNPSPQEADHSIESVFGTEEKKNSNHDDPISDVFQPTEK